jgi:hypothetical protein
MAFFCSCDPPERSRYRAHFFGILSNGVKSYLRNNPQPYHTFAKITSVATLNGETRSAAPPGQGGGPTGFTSRGVRDLEWAGREKGDGLRCRGGERKPLGEGQRDTDNIPQNSGVSKSNGMRREATPALFTHHFPLTCLRPYPRQVVIESEHVRRTVSAAGALLADFRWRGDDGSNPDPLLRPFG